MKEACDLFDAWSAGLGASGWSFIIGLLLLATACGLRAWQLCEEEER